jgi:hypothetical protein
MLIPLLPLLLAAAPPDPAELRAQAQAAYDAMQFKQACPLFEKVTKLLPEDGAAWADLALCQFRMKKKDAGVRAALQALRFGDERTRKSTYFNLGKFAGETVFVTTKDCGQKLWTCTQSYSDIFKTMADGSGGAWSSVHLCPHPCTTDEEISNCPEIGLGGLNETVLGDPDMGQRTFGETHCKLVAVDSCNQRVGLTCEQSVGIIVPEGAENVRKVMQQRSWVEEQTFTPLKAAAAPSDGGT